jgi:hypothetical protein
MATSGVLCGGTGEIGEEPVAFSGRFLDRSLGSAVCGAVLMRACWIRGMISFRSFGREQTGSVRRKTSWRGANSFLKATANQERFASPI